MKEEIGINRSNVREIVILLKGAGYNDLAYLIHMLEFKISFYYDPKEEKKGVIYSKENIATIYSSIKRDTSDNYIKEGVEIVNKVSDDFDYLRISNSEISEISKLFKTLNVSLIDKIIGTKKMKQRMDFLKKFQELYDYSFDNDIKSYIRRYDGIINYFLNKEEKITEKDIYSLNMKIVEIFEDLLIYSQERKEKILTTKLNKNGTLTLIALEELMRTKILHFFDSFDDKVINQRAVEFYNTLSNFIEDVSKIKNQIKEKKIIGNIEAINLIRDKSKSYSHLKRNSLLDNNNKINLNDWKDTIYEFVQEIVELNMSEIEKKYVLLNILNILIGKEYFDKEKKEEVFLLYKEMNLRLKLVTNEGDFTIKSRKKI